jgi:DNA-binding transcriptional ArsR family regulator
MEKPPRKLDVSPAVYWKALAHPLRCGVLSLLANRQMTNEEMAKALGVESGALYFHTKHLLTANLIELAGTRPKGPIIEKLYRAVANEFPAPQPDFAGQDPPLYDIISSALELYRTSWQSEREQVRRLQFGYQVMVFVPQSTVMDTVAQLKAIKDRLVAENGSDPTGVPIALGTLMHALSLEAFGRKGK